MDLYGIGFSNIRMPNNSNSYTYKYDNRVNVFPEEVYVHEFLHSLERISKEYGYDRPALHDYEQYGYKTEGLTGLENWYKNYMRCKILDKTTNQYVGLNPAVYSFKPPHNSNFTHVIEIDFNKEPKNVIEDIRGLIKIIQKIVKK